MCECVCNCLVSILKTHKLCGKDCSNVSEVHVRHSTTTYNTNSSSVVSELLSCHISAMAATGLTGSNSLRICIVLFVSICLVKSLSGDTTGIHRRFEYKYSFKPPYLAQKDGTVPFWEYGGSKYNCLK